MKLRLPLILRRALCASFVVSCSWATFANTPASGNTQDTVSDKTADASSIFDDIRFLGDENDAVLSHEDWLISGMETPMPIAETGVIVTPLHEDTLVWDSLDKVKDASYVENAGAGTLKITPDFSSYKGDYKVTGGGTIEMISTTVLSNTIYLSNKSVFKYGGTKLTGAITGTSGTYIKTGTGTTVLTNVDKSFKGDFIVEGGAIRFDHGDLGDKNTCSIDVFGVDATGTITVNDNTEFFLRSGKEYRFSHDFKMMDGSKFSVFDKVTGIVSGEFYVGSGEKGVLLNMYGKDTTITTKLELSGGITGDKDKKGLIIFTCDQNQTGPRYLIISGDVKSGKERFQGTIRVKHYEKDSKHQIEHLP